MPELVDGLHLDCSEHSSSGFVPQRGHLLFYALQSPTVNFDRADERVRVMTTDDSDKPPRVAPALKSAPSIRQLYWCSLPEDAHLPEFWKQRPVVIVSFKNTLSGAVTVIPCSSQDQTGNRWACRLSTTIDGRASWAICDKPTTVAVSRLSPDKNGIKRLTVEEFNRLLAIMYEWLPRLSKLD